MGNGERCGDDKQRHWILLQSTRGGKLEKQAYGTMVFPSPRGFNNMVCSTLISDCHAAIDEITTAKKIYGTNIHFLKGKIVRRLPTWSVTDYISVPMELLKECRDVTVAIDVMYTKMAFLDSELWGIRVVMADSVNDISKPTLITPIKKIVNLYFKNMFKLYTILMCL